MLTTRILICGTVTSEEIPFVSLASVCRSLHCLIFTLTQAGGSCLLFRFACSVVLWGGRGTADKCHWPLCGALAVIRPHSVCPCLQRVCFPRLHCSGSRLLYRGRALCCVHFPGLSLSDPGFWVLHKDTDSVGPAFCAFPGQSSSGSEELEKRTLPGCSVPYPIWGPSLSSGPPVGCTLFLSEELDSSCDPPGKCRPSRISGSL